MISGSQFGMLAEIASCQVEYAYLAHATGKAEHYARVCVFLQKFSSCAQVTS